MVIGVSSDLQCKKIGLKQIKIPVVHNLKQKLAMKKNVLKVVIYITYTKTSNIMIIYSRKCKISPYAILYHYDVHIMVFKGLQIGLPNQFQ